MTNPIEWLDNTFSSRERAQDLLRPDLESGLLSQHDYQVATMLGYSGGTHRYWPYYYGAMGTAMGVGWARWFKRPRLSSMGQVLTGTFVGWLGSTYGQYRRVRMHVQVLKAMENPAAFSQALVNVSQRIGEPLPPSLRFKDTRTLQNARREDDGFGAQEPTSDSHNIPADHNNNNTNPQTTTTTSVSDRWEEIRRANAQAAPQSSWDALRRKQARNTSSSSSSSPSSSPASASASERAAAAAVPSQADAVDQRAQEQAQFDAMLEAERRMTRG